jgi:protease-4
VNRAYTIKTAQITLQELAQVEKPVWKKEDKFEKFMDKVMSEAISKISMHFVSGLKAY